MAMLSLGNENFSVSLSFYRTTLIHAGPSLAKCCYAVHDYITLEERDNMLTLPPGSCTSRRRSPSRDCKRRGRTPPCPGCSSTTSTETVVQSFLPSPVLAGQAPQRSYSLFPAPGLAAAATTSVDVNTTIAAVALNALAHPAKLLLPGHAAALPLPWPQLATLLPLWAAAVSIAATNRSEGSGSPRTSASCQHVTPPPPGMEQLGRQSQKSLEEHAK